MSKKKSLDRGSFMPSWHTEEESDMSDYGSQRWRCDVCQTWKQYKGEEHPFNCSLFMNKMELDFGLFKC